MDRPPAPRRNEGPAGHQLHAHRFRRKAEALSDRIGIMANGNLVDIGTSKELIKKTKTKNIEDAFVFLPPH